MLPGNWFDVWSKGICVVRVNGLFTMSVILEFSLPSDAFVLGDALGKDSDVAIEFDRIVPTEEQQFPFCWVDVDDRATFEREARAEPTLEQFSLVETVGDRYLYRTSWDGSIETVVDGITDAHGTVLGVRGANEQWRFRLRFPDRTHVRTFQRHYVQYDIDIEIEKLYDPSDRAVQSHYGLTEKQFVTLKLAFERGYFEEPRSTSLESLSEELGISPRAVSQRLRRAMFRLLENTIDEDGVGSLPPL